MSSQRRPTVSANAGIRSGTAAVIRATTPSQRRGSSDTPSGMEARVKRLEDDSKEVRADLKALLIDTAVLKERVSHLPTKGWAVGAVVTLVGLMGAFATLAPKLQAFFNIR